MAEEKLEYVYTGDASSLQNATKQAIASLNKYDGAIKKAASSGNLDVGKTAFTGFQKTLNGVIKHLLQPEILIKSIDVSGLYYKC